MKVIGKEMFDNEPAQTILIILVAFAYGAVASGCVLRTLFEGYAARARWDAWRILGLAVCFVWPLLLLAPLAHLLFGAKPAEKAARSRHVQSDRLRANG